MNEVQLYTNVHFGGNIVCLKIRSIVSYVGGSTKITTLRAHSSYKDFITLLEETSEIRREDSKLYNFVHGCAYAISSVQDFTVMINIHKTNPDTLFHIWIINELRVPSQNFIYDFCSLGKGLSTTKDTGSVDDDDVPQSNESFETIHTDVPPSNEPSILQSNVHLSNEHVLTFVPQSNEPFQTIPIDVHLSNKHCISQSNIHLSNEPVLTNVPPSNEPMLTNVRLSIKPEPVIGQTKTSAEF
ncbi:hypothetical protein GIB67_021182 [Kingdonia uniflora]|uniref:Uncharacterized protein n=1 Tax=Kingdonia uniflora TaxID=39325 RepID=A0A7J7LFC8_9MAGN|nr:hypothetical protein GIB67_021182 [Kingdonia uniflora]